VWANVILKSLRKPVSLPWLFPLVNWAKLPNGLEFCRWEALLHCNLWVLRYIANWVRPIVESPIPKTANTLAVLNATLSQCFSALTALVFKPTRIGLLRRRTKIILFLNWFWCTRLLQRNAWNDLKFSTASTSVYLHTPKNIDVFPRWFAR